MRCSPCIDVGDETLVLADETDVNDDTDEGEDTPWDIKKSRRVISSEVDLGSYEECYSDVDGDWMSISMTSRSC
jgi:hypothetical protein